MNVIDKSWKLFVGIVESKSRSEFSAKFFFFFSDSKLAEPKFDILSELVNNPGLKRIGEKICYLLDLKIYCPVGLLNILGMNFWIIQNFGWND